MSSYRVFVSLWNGTISPDAIVLHPGVHQMFWDLSGCFAACLSSSLPNFKRGPKYLLLFVIRFRYIINNVTKDRCSIPMDTTVRLGPLKFSLQATLDHHLYIILHLSIVAKHILLQRSHNYGCLELLTAKTLLLHMLYYMNWLTHDFWTRTGRWEFDRSHGGGTSSPFHWQQVEEQAPKPVGWMKCFLLMLSDDNSLIPVVHEPVGLVGTILGE